MGAGCTVVVDLLLWSGMSVSAEDLSEIERAGCRCAVCRSGRGWRRFEVVRTDERAPIVLCGSCRARFGDDPPVAANPAPEQEAPKAAEQPVPAPEAEAGESAPEPGPDRLRAALDEMPGLFSTGMVARAAGLNNKKALVRLQDLESRGEIRRVGNRWSTESPPSDLAAAMDRLQARTSNLRIVRERTRTG